MTIRFVLQSLSFAEAGSHRQLSNLSLSMEEPMKTSQVVAIICMTGALIAFSGVPSGAQHSSGGTSPSVTEGKTGSEGTQGAPGSGQNAQQGGSGSGMGEANPPESSKGTGYG